MNMLMNMPVIVTMSGLLAWLLVLRQGYMARATAVALAFNSLGNAEFPEK